MSDSVKWANVWQSVKDFWLPTFGWIIAIVAVVIIVRMICRKKR